jgi:hypothetical protein
MREEENDKDDDDDDSNVTDGGSDVGPDDGSQVAERAKTSGGQPGSGGSIEGSDQGAGGAEQEQEQQQARAVAGALGAGHAQGLHERVQAQGGQGEQGAECEEVRADDAEGGGKGSTMAKVSLTLGAKMTPPL